MTAEDTELLREIRDLLKRGVELKELQVLGDSKYDVHAPRVPLGLRAEQDAHGARVSTVETPEPKEYCHRCQTWNYRKHIHTEIP